MEFLRKLVIPDYWYLYDIICALFGLLLCFLIKKKQTWNQSLSLIICAVNAFWAGGFLCFRFYYNSISFWTGGLLGIMLIIIFYVLLREKNIMYIAFLFICVKILCLLSNLFIRNSFGRTEEYVILFSYFISILITGGYIYFKNELNIKYDIMTKVLFPLYGSFLITGCVFDFFHEIVYIIPDYLLEQNEYINLYKYIAKVDWTEDGTAIIFIGLFLFVFVIGIVMQNHEILENKRKIPENN